MRRVGKVVPPKRQILKNISLVFFPGAKIGVLGLNGSGKSSLLEHHGGRGQGLRRRGGADAEHAHRLSCRRSRSSIPARPCAKRSRRAWATCSRRSRSSTRSMPPTPSPTPTSTSSPTEQAKFEAIIAAAGADVEHQLEIAADALRLPPWDAKIEHAVRRREAPRGAVPAAAVQARHAAARRADQPPRRRERRVARAVPAEVSRHRGRGDPRPLLPRQRRRVDPRARPRPRHSVEGQLQRPGWSRRSSASRPRRSRSRRASRR